MEWTRRQQGQHGRTIPTNLPACGESEHRQTDKMMQAKQPLDSTIVPKSIQPPFQDGWYILLTYRAPDVCFFASDFS